MASFLKHLKTGEILPNNPDLARHSMMMPYEPVPEGFVAPPADGSAPAQPKAKRKSKAKAKPAAAPAPLVEPEPVTEDNADEDDSDGSMLDLEGLDI